MNTKHSSLLLIFALTTLGVCQGQGPTVLATVPAKAAPGKTLTATVEINVPDGYHIYGTKVATGTPTDISFRGPQGYKASVKYPKTHTYQGFGDAVEVYTGDVKIPVVVSVPKNAKGTVSFKLIVTEQACNDSTCLSPATRTFTLKTSVK